LLIASMSVMSFAFAQKVPRSVAPEDLEKYWVLMKASVAGNAPLGGKNMDQSGCAAVSFIVEGNGRASNITIEKVEPPGGLGELARSIAGTSVQAMSNAGRDRVFSSLIFPFNLPADADCASGDHGEVCHPSSALESENPGKTMMSTSLRRFDASPVCRWRTRADCSPTRSGLYSAPLKVPSLPVRHPASCVTA
jgi:hypothetical protein